MSVLARSSSHLASLDAVWRASELSQVDTRTVASGHAGLDAHLPGAGWPRGHLTEVLQAQAGLHEWRLLLPALRACLEEAEVQPGLVPRTIVLIGCPHAVNLSALGCQGLAARALLWVDVAQPADRLWAAEQALRCQDLAALMLWAPQVRPGQLRRLQVAAQSSGAGAGLAGASPAPLVFVFRPWATRLEASPAPLRAGLRLASRGQLEVHLLKRRGPPLQAPVLLQAGMPPALLHRSPQQAAAHFSASLNQDAVAQDAFGDSRLDTLVEPSDHAVDRPRAESLPGPQPRPGQPLAA